eukprot:IDg1492t1
MQSYFKLAIFKVQDEKEVTPSISMAFNLSPVWKKYNTSYKRIEYTACRTFGTPWTIFPYILNEESLYLITLVPCYEAAQYSLPRFRLDRDWKAEVLPLLNRSVYVLRVNDGSNGR